MFRLSPKRFASLGALNQGGEVTPDEQIEVYNPRTNTTWRRGGGCRSECGVCCTFIILPIDRRVLQSPHLEDWEKWLNLHGVELAYHGDKCEARIPIPCRQLTWELTCAIKDDPDRPEMCAEFPMKPDQLVNAGLAETCSYTWTEEEQ